MGATEEKLSQFIAAYPVDQIPPEILDMGKRLLMSHLAVAIYSSQDPALTILLELFEEEGGRRRASILGTGIRTNLLNAALANGFLGHFEDFDDTHLATSIHAGSAILPAALALGESLGLHGRKFLAGRRHWHRGRLSHRQYNLSPCTGSRRNLASDELLRSLRGGGGGGASAGADAGADRARPGYRRVPGSGLAGDLRVHDEAAAGGPGRPERAPCGTARPARLDLHNRRKPWYSRGRPRPRHSHGRWL